MADEKGVQYHHHQDDNSHDHRPNEEHQHGKQRSWLAAIFHRHGHSHQDLELASDQAFRDNQAGIRITWLALALLILTSVLQIIIVALSGSVALLADTAHNIGDALNSIPLLVAFYLARRAASRRYNYGYGKAEDVAGVFIVLSIALSAAIIFWESWQKFLNPRPIEFVGWVATAALIGFAGNEAVAWLQIRTGRRIGSAAMVADGQHARTDGLTSLAVLLAAAGSALGFPILDPIIGVLIGMVILFIGKEAAVAIWYRLMDAIEPELLNQGESIIECQPGVRELRRLRMRWVGHRLQADVYLAVDPGMSTLESHRVAESVRHALFHGLPKLSEIIVHVDPWLDGPDRAHEVTRHHEAVPQPLPQ